MAKTYPVIERTGERITVLARSAEEAHAAASDALDGSCRIVSVEKVRSGGVGGFFATELVRLVASSNRAAPDDAPARTTTFASAEELLQALPQSAEFAARLKEEIALLTAKGLAAADTQIPTAAERAELAASLTRRAAPPASEPIAVGVDGSAAAASPLIALDDDSPLPDSVSLRWAEEPAEQDAPNRLWRRAGSGRREAIETSSVDVVAERTTSYHTAPETDEALLWALGEAESEPARIFDSAAPDLASWAPAFDSADGAHDDDQAGNVDALLAEALSTELEIEDRPVTARAQRIRTGRAAWMTDSESPEFGGLAPDHAIDADAAPDPDADPDPDASPVVETPVLEAAGPETVAPVEIDDPVDAADPMIPAPPLAPVAPMAVPVVGGRGLPQAYLAPSSASSWSAPTLRAFGVPDTIVERMLQHRPSDDTEWAVAFMLAVRHLCQPIPDGPTVLAGPAGANLARQLGLVSLTGDELAESTCSVASPNVEPLALRNALGGRRVHLMIGGGWHHLVTVRPDTVSAASDFDLLEALRVAEAWGAVLGWVPHHDRYVRIDPYLLVGRVRAMLPSTDELGSSSVPTNMPYR